MFWQTGQTTSLSGSICALASGYFSYIPTVTWPLCNKRVNSQKEGQKAASSVPLANIRFIFHSARTLWFVEELHYSTTRVSLNSRWLRRSCWARLGFKLMSNLISSHAKLDRILKHHCVFFFSKEMWAGHFSLPFISYWSDNCTKAKMECSMLFNSNVCMATIHLLRHCLILVNVC